MPRSRRSGRRQQIKRIIRTPCDEILESFDSYEFIEIFDFIQHIQPSFDNSNQLSSDSIVKPNTENKKRKRSSSNSNNWEEIETTHDNKPRIKCIETLIPPIKLRILRIIDTTTIDQLRSILNNTMVSAPRRDPINRLHNIKDARRARRQHIRELMNRPTTIYIDRDIIPEEIIEALETRVEPHARIVFSPIDNENDSNSDINLNGNSNNEQDSSSDSDSSDSYIINDNSSLNGDPISLSDYEEWEARAEIIQSEEHYNVRDNSAPEDIAIEFSPSPSPLFILPHDEVDNLPEDLIPRLLRDISDDQLSNMIDDVDWSFVEEENL